MGLHVVLVVIFLCYHLLLVNLVQCTSSISINNIQDKYGDTYDCVDSYKQVAFDHPLLKNHTIDFQIISNPFHDKASEIKSSTIHRSFDTFLKVGMCPVGTIPIRKISVNDVLRERQIIEANKTETINRPNTYVAITRTKDGPSKYSGAGGYIKVDNPKAVGQQFSSTRIRLQVGSNSIEAGWRVDPSLYGDSRTRLFIRTDAGRTHCFNIRCPGFIQTSHKYNLDYRFHEISIPGGYAHLMPYYIIRDNKNGNWNFVLGDESTLIGYWPSQIFTGSARLANRVEWGGTAYSPPGTPLPPMGSGNHPVGDPRWDGTVGNIKVMNEKGQKSDASDTETYADDSRLYSVRDLGYDGTIWEHVIIYGGPGHK